MTTTKMMLNQFPVSELLSQEVIYICIKTHGGVCTVESEKGEVETTLEKIDIPKGLTVTKFNISIPGTSGLSLGEECPTVSKAFEDNPSISKEEMTNIIFNTYLNTLKNRREWTRKIRKNEPFENWDMIFYTAPPENPDILIEPKSYDPNKLLHKEYIVDDNYDKYLHSIEILNGEYKGQNILEQNFFLQNILHGQRDKINPEEWHTFNEGNLTVLKEITIAELLDMLVKLNIKNVYIIDPSCSNNIYATSATQERYLKRSYMKNYQDKRKQPEQNCVNCVSKDSCKIAAATGAACCIGSSMLCSLNPVAAVGVGATSAAVAAASYPLIEKMKREGGNKKHKTKRRSKHKKHKTKKYRKYKTKRHMKNKTKGHFQ